MKNLFKNRKILLLAALMVIIIFAFMLYFIIQKRTSDDISSGEIPKGPTIVPSVSPQEKRLILPMKDDDPRRWIDKNGNRIHGDNLTE